MRANIDAIKADEVKTAFAKILGTDGINDSKENANFIIYPQTQTQLQQAIALCHQHRWQIHTPNYGWGGLVKFTDVGIVVDRSSLNRLIDHAVGDLTVTCEAGMKFQDLQNILAASGQFLAINPAYSAFTTIAEIIDTANTGSLRHRYGGVRDMLLGVAFVRADGKGAKAGGRVVKNVAGYDLMKLLTGAYSSLGIISEVTFRLYPLPQSDRTIIITGTSPSINQLRAEILTSHLTPWTMDIISQGILEYLSIFDTEIGLVLRFGGLTASVSEQIRRLAAIAAQVSTSNLNISEDNTIYSKIHDLLWQSPSVSNQSNHIICKIGTLSDHIIETLLEITAIVPNALVLMHDGLGILKLPFSSDDRPSILETILKFRHLLETSEGFLTILEAPSSLKSEIDPWGYTGNAKELMMALKQKFDPHNLLNPHQFIAGISG